MRTENMLSRFAFVALVAVGAVGCTRAAPMGLQPLDEPAIVSASGAATPSQVTIYRKGALDPSGSLVVLPVQNATLLVRSTASDATVEELVLTLGDADMAPTESMPGGVKLRKQELHLATAMPATIEERTSDALNTRAHGSLVYKASLVLDDGTLYPLGATTTAAADLDVRITRYEFGVQVTLDAAPQGSCWSVPGVIEVSDCSLYVETSGDARASN
jgi:hypothetical protein